MSNEFPIWAQQQFAAALAHFAQGNWAQAEAEARKILAADPRHVQSIRLLAQLARVTGQLERALQILLVAAQIAPGSAELLHETGGILYGLGRTQDAMMHYRQAIAADPNYRPALGDLAETLFHAGRPEEAEPLIRRALLLHSEDGLMHEHLLRILRCHGEKNPELVFAEHVRWGQIHADPFAWQVPPPPFRNRRMPDRPLRVGYVSLDLHAHASAFFIEDILTRHDPLKAEVFVFADVIIRDAVTDRLQKSIPNWREITRQPDAAVVEMIRGEQIDILVDLAGHSKLTRLGLFARKPSPIQISYLGYPDTTGMKAMDYRLVDALTDPPGMTERFCTEKLLRLPAPFVCYRPPENAPDVAPPPAHAGAPITFGSFNSLSKINQELLTLWAHLLRAVPNSRLLIKGWLLADPAIVQWYQAEFQNRGISPGRLILRPGVPEYRDHLAAYREVDIALDTFPYHGTATTCEALWMGVPVITLAGHTHAARIGVSLLNAVGHPEWIAASEADYVDLAAKLAADPQALAQTRSRLRAQMKSSPLLDAPRHVRNLEAVYREAWQAWCGVK